MRANWMGWIGAAIAAVVCTRGHAQVWDLAADWSNEDNPNGPWAYNEGDHEMCCHWASLHMGDPTWAMVSSGVPAWVQRGVHEGLCDSNILPGQIYTHADKGTGLSNVEWTAPDAGVYAVRGATWWLLTGCPPAGHGGRRMDWRFMVNGAVLQSGNIGDNDGFSIDDPARFGRIVCLEQGDVVRVEYQRTTTHSTFGVLDWSIESPPVCRADLDVSGGVDVGDLLVLLAAWGGKGDCMPEDFDGDGVVAIGDLLELLAQWGPC